MNKDSSKCALIHDLGEAITEIFDLYKTATDEVVELDAIDQLLSTISGSFKDTLKPCLRRWMN